MFDMKVYKILNVCRLCRIVSAQLAQYGEHWICNPEVPDLLARHCISIAINLWTISQAVLSLLIHKLFGISSWSLAEKLVIIGLLSRNAEKEMLKSVLNHKHHKQNQKKMCRMVYGHQVICKL